MFLQKWRAMVEVRFLRSCVDPNAPQEPLDADAQAEVDGGHGGGEVPLDEDSRRTTTAASPALLPAGPLPRTLPPPLRLASPAAAAARERQEPKRRSNRFTGFRNLGRPQRLGLPTDFFPPQNTQVNLNTQVSFK